MRTLNTRILLSTAAIGVAGGFLSAGFGYAAAIVATFLPVAYGITVGSHFLPSVIALALLRRGGTAILTGLIAGLVATAFAPQWATRYIGTGLLVGALIELPFALTRYRLWSSWLFYVSAAFAGVVLGGAVFIAMGASYFEPLLMVVYIAMFALSPILFTWLGRLVASALIRAGVQRQVNA